MAENLALPDEWPKRSAVSLACALPGAFLIGRLKVYEHLRDFSVSECSQIIGICLAFSMTMKSDSAQTVIQAEYL